MIKSQGTIRIKPKSSRRLSTRAAAAQSILQALTFASAIVFYHHFFLPQLTIEARQQGQAIGWQNAIKNTCPNQLDKVGG